MIAKGSPIRVPFEMLSLLGEPDLSAVVPTVVISADGGAAASSTNTPQQIAGTHVWTVLLTADESTADLVVLIATRDDDFPSTKYLYTESVYTTTKAGYLTDDITKEDDLDAAKQEVLDKLDEVQTASAWIG